MWQFALSKVNAKPYEVLHVDDDCETGIIGAKKKAGMRPFFIDQKGKHTSVTDCPVIRNLTEIFELV